MHSDQYVSLRPGGGKGRPVGPRIGTSATSNFPSETPVALYNGKGIAIICSKSEVKRIQYTKDFLFSLRDNFTCIPKEIRDAAQVIDSELGVPHDPEWSQPSSQTSGLLPTSRITDLDKRDWKAKPILDERTQEKPLRVISKKSDVDWRANKEPEHHVSDQRMQEQPVRETGRRSDTNWRLSKEPEHNDFLLRAPHKPEFPVPQFPSRQHDPLYNRQPDSQYVGQQESYLYPRQQEISLHPRQQDPQYARHYEPFLPTQQVDMARSAPAIARATNPWMARRNAMSEKEKVLRTVKGILNKLTPEKFDVLVDQLLKAGIDSAEILKGVISLVFDKAVLEPTFCPLYAELCVHLSKALPEFPSDEADGKPVTFRRILLNSCQEEFEGIDKLQAEVHQLTKSEEEAEHIEKEKFSKLRMLGNIKLIGELFKLKMIPEMIVHHCIQMLLGSDSKRPPAEENIEALCRLFVTVGKRLEESNKNTFVEAYFSQMKEYSTSSLLTPRIRFLILDTIDLRDNKWVPRREEVKAKTLHEIHAEAEKTLGIRSGTWNGRSAPGFMGFPGMMNPIVPGRPSGMMPGMPGLLPPAAVLPEHGPLIPNLFPGVDPEKWQYPVARGNKMIREGLMPPPILTPVGAYGMSPVNMRSNIGPNVRFCSHVNVPYIRSSSALLGDPSGRPGLNITPHLRHGPSLALNNATQRGLVRSIERVGTPAKQTMTASALPPGAVQKKTQSLLEEFFSLGDLDEALLCVRELNASDFHAQLVEMGVTMALESTDRARDLIPQLLNFLWSKRTLSQGDIHAGILLVADQLEDLTVDVPLAPKHLGCLIGKACLDGFVDLELLIDILRKVEDSFYRKSVYDEALKTIRVGPKSDRLMNQRYKLEECERLVGVVARIKLQT
ncbi:hypothetical protein KP509_36G027000 [Ceratopteris richardii]|uniref:MI domain-containing protein n=1 Tax=Ceratopteris richardii TaxID=49495 RepID=A0A8T2QCX4_CERRI|nr:hypothetical protein KP509_36G027000 [Ceratopteris richardii]